MRRAGKPVARSDAAREALRDAEVRVLAERVRAASGRSRARQAPRAAAGRSCRPAPAAPPIIQYITLAAPQYPAASPEPVNAGCGFGWPDCTFGWYPGFYPASVFVSRDKHFDHRGDHRGDHRADHRRPPSHAPGRGLIAPWLPITAPGGRGNYARQRRSRATRRGTADRTLEGRAPSGQSSSAR